MTTAGMLLRPINATDFYKVGHRVQYPDGTQLVYSNFTARGDRHAHYLPGFDHKIVFFGLQGVAQWLLSDLWKAAFFDRPRDEVLAHYKRRMETSLGGEFDVRHIGELHELGYLPVLIKALPEGSRVDLRVPMYSIRNTDPKFFWVTNYLETQLSAETWKPITSAITAYEYRRLIEEFAKLTGAPIEFVPWQGHDFSFRGMSGIYDAAQSGAGHLLSFFGTDTIPAIDYLEDYYDGADCPVIGGSVPATEHSVMCMGGKETEIETFRRLITQVYPRGIVSIVSDTWDFWRVITEYASALKTEIVAREQLNEFIPGKVVFRPDSGDPVLIVCGDNAAPEDSPQYKGAIECLWDIFGGTITAKGYKQLDSHVGLIYGDSITLDRAHRILAGLEAKGFASSNIVFGIGSFSYQAVTRDSFGTAIKATYGQVDGVPRELFKEPKTDDGLKKSARGLLRVENEGGRFVLYDRQTPEQEIMGALEPVWKDGVLLRRESLATIRARLLGSVA